MNPRSSLYRQTLEEEKRTVGGLLLLFCVTRTVISPVFKAIQYYFVFERLGGPANVFARTPLFYVLVGVDVLLTVLGIWAGSLLWQMRARGILLAKIYLVASVVLPLGTALIFQALGMGAIAQQLGATLVPAAFFGILWFIYLATSERVKNIREIERERHPAI